MRSGAAWRPRRDQRRSRLALVAGPLQHLADPNPAAAHAMSQSVRGSDTSGWVNPRICCQCGTWRAGHQARARPCSRATTTERSRPRLIPEALKDTTCPIVSEVQRVRRKSGHLEEWEGVRACQDGRAGRARRPGGGAAGRHRAGPPVGPRRGPRQGHQAGLAEGKQNALLRVLARARLVPTTEERERIATCTDLATLDRWSDNALAAGTVSEIFS
jgi:hypothetical protein